MMDPANSTLRRMLLDEITPMLMVLGTPLVEESSQKNGLSFFEVLSPFCFFNNIDVPVRTASDLPYRLQKFKLRLFYASNIRKPNIEAAKEQKAPVITRAGERDFPDISSDTFPIEALFTNKCMPSLYQHHFSLPSTG